jgi:hypothetical protein
VEGAPPTLSGQIQLLFNKVVTASRRLQKESSVIKSCESSIVSIVNPSHQEVFPEQFSEVGRDQSCPSHHLFLNSPTRNANGKIFPSKI